MAPKALNHTLKLSLLVVIVCVCVPIINTRLKPKATTIFLSNQMASATEIYGVKIENRPPETKLRELGVASWSKWECGPSKFPWTFAATETMYLLEGKVKVYVDGHEKSFEIAAGDLVIFPKGMNIIWDVIETVKKHYSLEK